MTATAPHEAGFSITVEPSGRHFVAQGDETILAAGIRQGIGLPYGCKDGACGSCKCKKLSGEVTLGPHQSKALSAEEQLAGFVLTCCAHATSDVVLESRQVTEAGALPIRKMPVRVMALTRQSHDVMLVRLQLPAGEPLQFYAGQYVEFILRDGARRSYSMANAPHTVGVPGTGIELHLRHLPGGKFTDHVFGTMKEKEILRIEGPFGSFFLREDSDKPMVLLASGTGFAPIKALLEHMQFKGITRPCTWTPGYVSRWRRCPSCATCPSSPTRRRRTTGPAAPASSTRPCWKTSPTCRATRSMPAGHPSWSTRPSATTWRWPGCPKKSSLQTRSPPRPTRPFPDSLNK